MKRKLLEEIYQDIIDSRKTDMIEEGLLDRLGARASGFGAGAKTVASNIGKGVGGIFKGGNTQYDSPEQASTDAKLKSIITSFKNDVQKLFPDKKLDNLENEVYTSIVQPPPVPQNISKPEPSVPEIKPEQPKETPVETPKTIVTPEVTKSQPIITPSEEPQVDVPEKPKEHFLNKRQLQKINKRILNEPRVKKSVSKLLNKPEGQQIRPTQKLTYKQLMSVKRLIGEHFEEVYQQLLDVPKL
jgi:hypothetical protein